MKKIILASASATRKKLMDALGLEYEIIRADIDEKSIRDNDLSLRAQKIAYSKGENVASRIEGIIIAADTFVSCDGAILEKPRSFEEAKDMWRLISGKEVLVYTGFCYIDQYKDMKISETITTIVTFQDVSENIIEHIINTVPVLNLSGAFNVLYPECAIYSSSINGSLTNIYGLPMERVNELLVKSEILN